MQDQCTPTSTTRTCTKCGETKSVTQFSRDKTRHDGLCARCKPCIAAACKEWGQANPDRLRATKQAYYATHRDALIAAQRRRGPAYYAANRSRIAQKNAEWWQANRDLARSYAKTFRLANSRKYHRAHQAVYEAVKRGTLIRPVTCETCGSGGKIDGAHADYSRPLDVRWLCRSCHVRWDREEPKLR